MNETSTIAITGGAQGIGLATARLLASRGRRIAVLDLSPERAAAAAASLDAEFPDAAPHDHVGVDVRDEAAVRAAFMTLIEHHGHLDGLVNGAGVLLKAPAESIGLDAWQTQIDVHLTGAMLCSRAAYPGLMAAPSPAIVNVASVGASLGLPGRLAYSTAKSGVLGLTRTLAAEWGPRGVRVNAIAPGYIATDMVRAGLDSGALDESILRNRTPLRRLGTPEEIAAVIAFLLSADASFVHGAVVAADGGITIDGTFD